MYKSRTLRKHLRIVKQVRDAGIPDQGWGPTTQSLEAGRREFYGIALSDTWAQTRVLIYFYSDEKTQLPGSFELRLIDPQGREVSELSDNFSSGDIWWVTEFEHLISSLGPGKIFWLDPVESFRLAYV